MSSLLVKKLDIFVSLKKYEPLKTTKYIESKIERLPRGYVFTYEDFIEEVNQKEAVIKALNRMVASNKIAKLSKGKYYKPEETVFGTLEPGQYQVVKDLLEEDGKTVGYLTGLSIYNQLGLTTQVGNIIQVGKNNVRPKFKRERYIIIFVKQKNTITKENIPLLQLLDSIKYIKKIPDTTVEQSCKRFLSIIKTLEKEEVGTMVRLVKKYPPSTRALLGALLDNANYKQFTNELFTSLNPITKYSIKGVSKILENTSKWNIQ